MATPGRILARQWARSQARAWSSLAKPSTRSLPVNIVGRIKDMIIRGGENIYPSEVEEYLLTHADVIDAQVIGVPSEPYGEEVMAWVRAGPGAALTVATLNVFCKGRIATYKIPSYWRFVDAFPITVTRWFKKFRMREVAIAERQLERAASVVTA
ncbi:MAG TPA: hypothetical protein VM076_03000 [Gemmatimonadaceae bacterium]|nr:hypothetical protein [Gemmatimonadaceae bacterium]